MYREIWCWVLLSTSKLTQHLNLNLYREIPRNPSFSIWWISGVRCWVNLDVYRKIWVSEFGGLPEGGILGGNCNMPRLYDRMYSCEGYARIICLSIWFWHIILASHTNEWVMPHTRTRECISGFMANTKHSISCERTLHLLKRALCIVNRAASMSQSLRFAFFWNLFAFFLGHTPVNLSLPEYLKTMYCQQRCTSGPESAFCTFFWNFLHFFWTHTHESKPAWIFGQMQQRCTNGPECTFCILFLIFWHSFCTHTWIQACPNIQDLQQTKRALLSIKKIPVCCQTSPTFYQKSPVFYQKNPVFYQKSPAFNRNDPCMLSNELYIPSKDPCILSEKPIVWPKEPYLLLKSPAFCQKSPGFYQKSPVFCQKSPVFCQKSPVFYQKSPTFYKKSPVFCQNSPVFCQKSPVFYRKSLILYPKSLIFSETRHAFELAASIL